mmetsp:Transcript_74683/g.180549  ORF Transcript_74683/g.180549 Transcript_74683/m.180549 type:complete len:293 (-) Transcript_74683:279-1157(-)
MSTSFLLSKTKGTKLGVGEEGASPATVISAHPPPSPALLPRATMSGGHEAPAEDLTLSEPQRAASSTLRALGVAAVLAAVVLAPALMYAAIKEPTAPPLPPPVTRRRCIDPLTCWTVPAPQPQAQAASTISFGLLTRGARPTTEAPRHSPKAPARKPKANSGAAAATERAVPSHPWWGGHGPSHPWWTVWVGESAGLARRKAPATARDGSLRMWRASQQGTSQPRTSQPRTSQPRASVGGERERCIDPLTCWKPAASKRPPALPPVDECAGWDAAITCRSGWYFPLESMLLI